MVEGRREVCSPREAACAVEGVADGVDGREEAEVGGARREREYVDASPPVVES